MAVTSDMYVRHIMAQACVCKCVAGLLERLAMFGMQCGPQGLGGTQEQFEPAVHLLITHKGRVKSQSLLCHKQVAQGAAIHSRSAAVRSYIHMYGWLDLAMA